MKGPKVMSAMELESRKTPGVERRLYLRPSTAAGYGHYCERSVTSGSRWRRASRGDSRQRGKRLRGWCDRCKGERILGAYIEQQSRQQPVHGQCTGKPDQHAGSRRREATAQNHCDDLSARRANRDSQPDLRPPLSHAVGRHRINADSGKQQGHRRKSRGERRREPRLSDRLRQPVIKRPHLVGRHCGIDLAESRLEVLWRPQRGRSSGSLRPEDARSSTVIVDCGNCAAAKYNRRGRLALQSAAGRSTHVVAAYVAGDTDDIVQPAVDLELLADRISSWPELTRRRLIDDDDRWRSCDVSLSKTRPKRIGIDSV